jgi:hypothetical protein
MELLPAGGKWQFHGNIYLALLYFCCIRQCRNVLNLQFLLGLYDKGSSSDLTRYLRD